MQRVSHTLQVDVALQARQPSCKAQLGNVAAHYAAPSSVPDLARNSDAPSTPMHSASVSSVRCCASSAVAQPDANRARYCPRVSGNEISVSGSAAVGSPNLEAVQQLVQSRQEHRLVREKSRKNLMRRAQMETRAVRDTDDVAVADRALVGRGRIAPFQLVDRCSFDPVA